VTEYNQQNYTAVIKIVEDSCYFVVCNLMLAVKLYIVGFGTEDLRIAVHPKGKRTVDHSTKLNSFKASR
jgi:hypothetical protein